jgi:hypothetical protein
MIAMAACGSEDPPDTAEIRSCLREANARLEPPTRSARRSPVVPPRTTLVGTVRWPRPGEAVVHEAADDDAADEAEGWLVDTTANFGVASEQVRREGVFVVLLGPVEVPTDEQVDLLVDCLS